MTAASINIWHFVGAFIGVALSFYPALIRKVFPKSAGNLELTDMAVLGAAFVSIYSAMWWVVNALTLDSFANTMAATYAASAAFFTSASFRLKGVEGETNPKADLWRIRITYLTAQWLPALLLILMVIQFLWSHVVSACRAV